MIDNLESLIKKLEYRRKDSDWADYYNRTNYSSQSFEFKKNIVAMYLDKVKPATVWDFGANTGVFSKLAGDRGIFTISFDMDPQAVQLHYRQLKENNDRNILPLVFDLVNPSPGIGWANKERLPLGERGKADMIFAFALIHHLVISNNLSFDQAAHFFSRLCSFLAIEFIHKNDSQITRMLKSRNDIFINYNQECFDNSFRKYFDILDSIQIPDSERVLYLMKKSHHDQTS